MERYQKGIIIALLLLSVMSLVVPAVFFGVRRAVVKPPCGARRKLGVSRMLIFSGCLIGAVWCLRYAVGYFSILSSGGGDTALTWWEEIFNSVAHALQTFSLDEDYTKYILDGKRMLRTIFGENVGWKATAYGLYASMLNFAAPIAGGAVIFEILASIFPRIKLFLSHIAFWKETYYFSELNEASLALTKSICGMKTGFWKKPVIVFTDVYADSEDEKNSEMLLEAKLLGAICIRDDLSHVPKNRFGGRRFFLMDLAEIGNLQTLADLANSDNRKYLKNAEIYYFTVDDAYIQVERSVYAQLRKQFSEEELPVLVPIQNCRNLISNLLVDVPLYEPLIGKKKNESGERDLTVTILGTGRIGTEMFLSTYWFGQILDCNLKINVVSQESEAEFWGKIDYVNPEIKRTTMVGDPLLRINRKGDMADPYCKVEYFQCDVKSTRFMSCLMEQNKHILDTDYFLVSLGSDETNISVANTVKNYVGQFHIKTAEPRKTVIAYVVYNSELSEALNKKRYYSFTHDGIDVYMQAIGSLRDVYSVRNIFLPEHEPFAQQVHQTYMATQNKEDRAKAHKARIVDDYKHWASMARAMYKKYMVFSAGMISESLFDYPNDSQAYDAAQEKVFNEYKDIMLGRVEFESPEREAEHLQLLHKLAWLEHRRWNAFTRVKGFRSTQDYDVYATAGVIGSYKQMDIKLHPCLVECDQNGIRANINAKGEIDVTSLFQCEERADFDLLDELSYDLYAKRYNDFDFKQYDYPRGAF